MIDKAHISNTKTMELIWTKVSHGNEQLIGIHMQIPSRWQK